MNGVNAIAGTIGRPDSMPSARTTAHAAQGSATRTRTCRAHLMGPGCQTPVAASGSRDSRPAGLAPICASTGVPYRPSTVSTSASPLPMDA